MENLLGKIKSINKDVKILIDLRIHEFNSFADKHEKDWFSELCFCILTANSKALTGIAIQNELKADGFLNKSQEEIRDIIIKHKHRFHNNKAKYITEARKYANIKDVVYSMLRNSSIIEVRNWIAENIKGLSYKEASHFLRNVGYDNIAILDRHILNLMKEHAIIHDIPKPLNKNKYLDIESRFNEIAKRLNMSPAKLDLCMWYLKTGRVLK